MTDRTDKLLFNTAISQMMIFVNHMTKQKVRSKAVLKSFALVLAPMPVTQHSGKKLWYSVSWLNVASKLAFSA